ncbi:hypothetical protein [Prevotella pallens]|uniref:hypothetical protein n=1 Tax=Prevotella pallens TaxID=60133 RepID=UPI003C7C3A81
MANIPQNIHIHPRKHPTYIPQGVGDRFIVPVSLHYQIHIFASSHTYVQITTPHYRNKFTHHQKT